jgi:hypothetical protein
MTRDCQGTSGVNIASRTRSIPINEPLPSNVDQDIFRRKGTRSITVSNGFQHGGFASHVLLAACAANERAVEENGRGAFTRVFLDVIKEFGYQNLTYEEIITRLPPLTK